MAIWSARRIRVLASIAFPDHRKPRSDSKEPLPGRAARSFSAEQLSMPTACRVHDLLDHLVHAEAGRLLAWREFLERLQEFGHSGLRRHEDKYVVEQPIVVGVGSNVRSFVRVRAQVEYLRHAQGDERLRPDP